MNRQIEDSELYDFGTALKNLKAGKAVARKGWNGKGMFLTLQTGSIVDGESMRNLPAKRYYEGESVHINTHIDMVAADGTYVVGWTASQADLIREDWYTVNVSKGEVK